jgi:hypothetical protein
LVVVPPPLGSATAPPDATHWGRHALAALRRPLPLSPADSRALRRALAAADHGARRAAQSALLARHYGGSPIAWADVSSALTGFAEHGGDPRPLSSLVGALAETPLAEEALDAALRWFEPGLAGLLVATRIDVLRQLLTWNPQALTLPRLVALLASDLRAPERSQLLGEVVEPVLLVRAEEIPASLLPRLRDVARDLPRWRYTLAALAGLPRASAATRRWAAAEIAGAFPWAATSRAALPPSPRLLLLQNLVSGQGDECIRIGPLLQGLLAALPDLRGTVLTPRPHLWEHPRLHVLDLADRPAAIAACAEAWDVVVEMVDRDTGIELNVDVSISDALRDALVQRSPALLVRGDQGATQFLFTEVRFAGREIGRALGLCSRGARQVYDPTQRLAAELGLPWMPAAWGGGREHDPLVGTSSPEAERLLAALLPAARPRALVNPFGGAKAHKGATPDRLDILARELAALVDEGYQALVLPTGTRWVSRALLDDLARRLDAVTRAHVAFAPDPAAEAGEAVSSGLGERPDLAHADRVMRLFKHFAAGADLVVAVEGWLGHATAQIGGTLRLVAGLGAFGPDWYPPGPREVTSALSRGALATVRASDRIEPEGRPPAPRLLARQVLVSCLEALPELPAAEALPVLLTVARSPGPFPRRAAIKALARVRPWPVDAVTRMLADPDPHVAAAAAEALLGAQAHGIAIGVREGTLRAYIAISRRRWQDIIDIGDDALPALAHAVTGDGDLLVVEARRVMTWLLAARRQGAFGTSRSPGPASPTG